MRRFSALGLVVALAVLGALAAGAQEKAEKSEAGWVGLRFRDYGSHVVVLHVVHGSPAEIAGIPSGCFVESVSGLDAFGSRQVPNAHGLDLYLHSGKVGQTCTFGVVFPRTGERKSFAVTLAVHDLAAHVRLALADGARILEGRRVPSGAGWERHVGSAGPEDVGSGITALAARALAGLPPDLRKPHEPAIDQALATLLSRKVPDGWVEDPQATAGQSYETYATAEAALAFAARGDRAEAIAALTSGLRGRQFGLPEGEGAFGGWFDELHWQYGGFPFEGNPFDRASVRVTVGGTAIALEGLRLASPKADDPALARARRYLARAQNTNDANDPLLADLKDGGFPERPFLSKAGYKDVGEDRLFRSYGSATADGLYALLAAGVPRDDARVKAASDWLRNHYDPRLGVNPGFEQERPQVPFDSGIHFYFLASLARALDTLGEDPFLTAQGTRHWGEDVANAVTGIERNDGSWKNPIEVMDEDNETIATSFALIALELADRHLGHPR